MGTSVPVPAPLSLNEPYGTTMTGTMRGSPDTKFGQWLAFVHDDGLALPRMRRFMPADTELVFLPGSTATQYSGGVPPGSLPVHACPVLRRYSGEQPRAISSSRFERMGSQSIVWFWLPPLAPTRSTVGSSVGFDRTSVPPRP